MARRRRRTAYLACAGVESLACRQETSLGSAPAAPLACACQESMGGSA